MNIIIWPVAGDRSSDVTAFATLRSRQAALVIATQSLDHLAVNLGPHHFAALLPNIGNYFFFRSTEARANVLASTLMGSRESTITAEGHEGFLAFAERRQVRRESLCPPGALSQLEPLQAYIALANGYRSPGAIWLAGNYETPKPDFAPPRGAAPASSVKRLHRLRAAALRPPDPAQEEDAGKALPPKQLLSSGPPQGYYDLSAWQLLMATPRFARQPAENVRAAFKRLHHSPAGLDTLPVCWVPAVVYCVRAHPRRPGEIIFLGQKDGFLEVVLQDVASQEARRWINRLRLSVYPSRARPLIRRDQRLRRNGP